MSKHWKRRTDGSHTDGSRYTDGSLFPWAQKSGGEAGMGGMSMQGMLSAPSLEEAPIEGWVGGTRGGGG